MSNSKNTLLVVILVAVALLLALGIVCVVYVSSTLKEIGKGFGGVSQLVETQRLVNPVRSALKRYLSDHQKFPDDLEALKEYLEPETLSSVKEKFQYLPPQKDAPDDTAILRSHDMPFFENSYHLIEIHKDLSVWLITKQKVPEGEQLPKSPRPPM